VENPDPFERGGAWAIRLGGSRCAETGGEGVTEKDLRRGPNAFGSGEEDKCKERERAERRLLSTTEFSKVNKSGAGGKEGADVLYLSMIAEYSDSAPTPPEKSSA